MLRQGEIDFKTGQPEFADQSGDQQDREHSRKDEKQKIVGRGKGGQGYDQNCDAEGEAGAGDVLA